MQRSLKASSWVSSPLGLRMALELFKSTHMVSEKNKEINNLLKMQYEGKMWNKMFCTSDHLQAKSLDDENKLSSEKVNFEDGSAISVLNTWITSTAAGLELTKPFTKDTTRLFANIHTFSDTWEVSDAGFPLMKVYNSFNYTQDVKYEARLVELPTTGYFKLIVLVPNERDVLEKMFVKLTTEGVAAAALCIQPLFTVSTQLKAPSISVDSEFVTVEHTHNTLQRGIVKVDEQGININVLTCIYDSKNKIETEKQPSNKEGSFYFALMHRDVSLFKGEYWL